MRTEEEVRFMLSALRKAHQSRLISHRHKEKLAAAVLVLEFIIADVKNKAEFYELVNNTIKGLNIEAA